MLDSGKLKQSTSAACTRKSPRIQAQVAPCQNTFDHVRDVLEMPQKSLFSALSLRPSIYVIIWICLSSSVILFNKWILHNLEFDFPIFLTTWHLIFATIATRVLAYSTNLLNGLNRVRVTRQIFFKAIMPIAFFYSLSLICSNQAYLYLSIAFIQMLKATTPVAVLLATWAMLIGEPNLKVLMNVSLIVFGVILASYGELRFEIVGFLFQIGGVIFEATRLVLVQQLLSSAEYKMDPLVSLYHFAPVCAAINFMIFLYVEAPDFGFDDVYRVGPIVLLLNAAVAFGLNVSVVFLIRKTSSLVLTLSGVLKDILLVIASVVIWHSPLTVLQIFGYSIALWGLVLYKLGPSKLKEAVAGFRIAGSGRRYKAIQKAVVACIGLIFVTLTLGRIYPHNIEKPHPRIQEIFPEASVSELYEMDTTRVS
ncbi:triose-phosphate transporter family-domain-containing protein [Tirmania nivea]|nr:triose-phosphate transporter family-domain-containing protein [Tirmania nivea]